MLKFEGKKVESFLDLSRQHQKALEYLLYKKDNGYPSEAQIQIMLNFEFDNNSVLDTKFYKLFKIVSINEDIQDKLRSFVLKGTLSVKFNRELDIKNITILRSLLSNYYISLKFEDLKFLMDLSIYEGKKKRTLLDGGIECNEGVIKINLSLAVKRLLDKFLSEIGGKND